MAQFVFGFIIGLIFVFFGLFMMIPTKAFVTVHTKVSKLIFSTSPTS